MWCRQYLLKRSFSHWSMTRCTNKLESWSFAPIHYCNLLFFFFSLHFSIFFFPGIGGILQIFCICVVLLKDKVHEGKRHLLRAYYIRCKAEDILVLLSGVSWAHKEGFAHFSVGVPRSSWTGRKHSRSDLQAEFHVKLLLIWEKLCWIWSEAEL